MKIKCPHCEKEFAVNPKAYIPEEQKVVMKIKTEAEFFSAQTVGRTIDDVAKTLKSIGKDLKQTVEVFIEGIELREREIEILLIVKESEK